MRRYLIAAVAALLVGVFAFPTTAGAKPVKVGLCHFDKKTGMLLPKSLTQKSADKHLAKHANDVLVGDGVDENCDPTGPASLAVAYWSFDDQTNPTSDSADGYDSTLFGPTFETVDIANTVGNVAALSLDGTDDYGLVADPGGAADLDDFTAMTIAAWIKPASSHHGGVLVKYNSNAGGAAGVSWGLDINGQQLRFIYSWEEFPSTGPQIVPGVWQHVAGTWDGNDVRLYLNGVEIAHGVNIFTAIPDNNTPVNIGAAQGDVGGTQFIFFDGLIDELFLFDQALSQPDIQSLMG